MSHGTLAAMATLDEAEDRDDLPWGFHDALLRALNIDWLHRRVVIELRPKVSERQDLDRGGRLVIEGLEWLVVDPNGPGVREAYDPAYVGGYDIDSRPGVAREGLPGVPEGAFAHYFFVFERNSFIHLCARDARFEWTDDAPTRCGGEVFFPGEEMPDPDP